MDLVVRGRFGWVPFQPAGWVTFTPALTPAHCYRNTRLPRFCALQSSARIAFESILLRSGSGASYALSCCVAIASCSGPWAQATHVVIAPLPGSKLSAQADVVEATTCVANRCQPRGGSTITLTVTGAEPRSTYEASLATGSCQNPTDQRVIARFAGSDGTRTHVATPVVPLTSGRYVIVLWSVDTQQSSGGCGVIKRGVALVTHGSQPPIGAPGTMPHG